MRILDMVDGERFRTGLFAAADTKKKPAGDGKSAAKANGAKPAQKAAPATATGTAKVVSPQKQAGMPKGKPPISPNHQKLHAMARTHGFKHVGMSVYQHPTAGLTLSVGPQGWSLSDGTSGTDWEDLQSHLEKSFGLPMQDPNQIDPITGQPMGAQPAGGAQRRPAGQGGMQQPGGPRQKNPNGFQQNFLGQ